MADLLVTDFGAVCDGSTNDTVAIQAAINAAVPGDRVYFPAGAHSRAWFLQLKSDLVLDLGTATLELVANQPPRVWMMQTPPGTGNVVIRGGVVKGSRQNLTGLQWGIGLRVDSASLVVVEGTTFQDWFFDGVWVGGNTPSTNVTLEGVTCVGNRRNGVSVVNANGVLLRGCKLLDTNGQDPQAGVDVEPNAGERVSGFTARACEFSRNRVGLYMHRGTGLGGQDYVVVGCSFHDNSRYGLIGNAMSGLLVVDNQVSGGQLVSPLGVAASLGDGVSDVTFSANTLDSPRSLVLAGASGLRVVSNRLTRPLEIVSVPGGGVRGDVVLLDNGE
jgi:hypothetical protein